MFSFMADVYFVFLLQVYRAVKETQNGCLVPHHSYQYNIYNLGVNKWMLL